MGLCCRRLTQSRLVLKYLKKTQSEENLSTDTSIQNLLPAEKQDVPSPGRYYVRFVSKSPKVHPKVMSRMEQDIDCGRQHSVEEKLSDKMNGSTAFTVSYGSIHSSTAQSALNRKS